MWRSSFDDDDGRGKRRWDKREVQIAWVTCVTGHVKGKSVRIAPSTCLLARMSTSMISHTNTRVDPATKHAKSQNLSLHLEQYITSIWIQRESTWKWVSGLPLEGWFEEFYIIVLTE